MLSSKIQLIQSLQRQLRELKISSERIGTALWLKNTKVKGVITISYTRELDTYNRIKEDCQNIQRQFLDLDAESETQLLKLTFSVPGELSAVIEFETIEQAVYKLIKLRIL